MNNLLKKFKEKFSNSELKSSWNKLVYISIATAIIFASTTKSFSAAAVFTSINLYLATLYLFIAPHSLKYRLIAVSPGFLCFGLLFAQRNQFFEKHANFGLFTFAVYFFAITWIFRMIAGKTLSESGSKIVKYLSIVHLLTFLILVFGVLREGWKTTFLTTSNLLPIVDIAMFLGALFLLFTHFRFKNKVKIKPTVSHTHHQTFQQVDLFIIIFIVTVNMIWHLFELHKENLEAQFFSSYASYSFIFSRLCLDQVINLTKTVRASSLARSMAETIHPHIMSKSLTKTQGVSYYSVPSFTIHVNVDHDGHIKNNLPRTLETILHDEFFFNIRRLLSNDELCFHHSNSHLSFAVDPEKAPLSGLQTLAAIYHIEHSVAPLVKRRMLGLSKLLPILEDPLYQWVKLHSIERIIEDSYSQIRVDYDWVDMGLYKNESSSIYKCQFPGVYGKDVKTQKDEILLSEQAKNQFILELPEIKDVLHPYKDNNDYFVVKIDDIGRLFSAYGNLFNLEEKLQDFEPSESARKLQQTIDRRLELIKSNSEIHHMISSINDYNWKGYKEKDIAIALLTKLLDEQVKKFESIDKSTYAELKMKIINSIIEIGYPSVYLHKAHTEKQGIRQKDILTTIALDPSHPQFYEVWIILANGLQKRRMDQKSEFLNELLGKAMKKQNLKASPMIDKSMIECLFQSLRTGTNSSKPETILLIRSYINSFKSSVPRIEALIMTLNLLRGSEASDQKAVLTPEVSSSLKDSVRKIQLSENLPTSFLRLADF